MRKYLTSVKIITPHTFNHLRAKVRMLITWIGIMLAHVMNNLSDQAAHLRAIRDVVGYSLGIYIYSSCFVFQEAHFLCCSLIEGDRVRFGESPSYKLRRSSPTNESFLQNKNMILLFVQYIFNPCRTFHLSERLKG